MSWTRETEEINFCDLSAGLFPAQSMNEELPVNEVHISGIMRTALVDLGAACSLTHKQIEICQKWSRQKMNMLTADGKARRSQGVGSIRLGVSNSETLSVSWSWTAHYCGLT